MGFKDSMALCQHVLERKALLLQGVSLGNQLLDRKPAPGLSPLAHLEYVDNFVALSQVGAVAEKAAHSVNAALLGVGLPTHGAVTTKGGETLGWSFSPDCAEIRASPRRLWKIRLALKALAADPVCSGKDMEVIVGHITFVLLLKRELLACLSAVYAFMQVAGARRTAIWPSVLRELGWVSALLPLVRRDLAAEWAGQIFASDASPSGMGVVHAQRSVSDIKAAGIHCDRWRYNRAGEELIQARTRAGVESRKSLQAREKSKWFGSFSVLVI